MHRADDVRRIADAHRQAGGAVYLVTYTIPHDQGDRLEPLYRAVADSYRYVRTGASWYAMKERIGYVGEVRAIEATIGANGWHPHLHVLLLTARELTEAELSEARDYMHRRWCNRIVRFGYRPPSSEHGVTIVSSHRDDYLAKMGLADELAKGTSKAARGASRTPLQVLVDFHGTGDAADLELWREWVEAMHGARQLTWSRGLRQLYGAHTEKTDAEIVAEDDGAAEESVATIPNDVWCAIMRADTNASWQLLDAAERGGADAVAAVIAERLLRIRARAA